MTATDINFVLGKLFKAIAQNRIPPRNASNLAFVGKLLLLSLDKLKTEFDVTYTHEHWVKMYVESKGLSNPPPATLGERQSAERQSTNDAVVVRDGGESTVGPNNEDSAGGQA